MIDTIFDVGKKLKLGYIHVASCSDFQHVTYMVKRLLGLQTFDIRTLHGSSIEK